MFIELPEYIAELVLDKNSFVSTLESTYLTNPFYSLEEFINV
jgi:hypothetical protein